MSNFSLATFIGLGVSCVLLAACQSPKVPTKPPQTGISPEQKQCAALCLTKQTRCQKQHKKLYQQCEANAQQQAKQHYEIYAKSRKAANKDVEKKESDFLNVSHCNQQLNCKTDYQSCYSDCGL